MGRGAPPTNVPLFLGHPCLPLFIITSRHHFHGVVDHFPSLIVLMIPGIPSSFISFHVSHQFYQFPYCFGRLSHVKHVCITFHPCSIIFISVQDFSSLKRGTHWKLQAQPHPTSQKKIHKSISESEAGMSLQNA